MANLNKRLDKIIDKIKEDKFIDGRGLGNEISFYVFDYEPEDELHVRDYIEALKKSLITTELIDELSNSIYIKCSSILQKNENL